MVPDTDKLQDISNTNALTLGDDSISAPLPLASPFGITAKNTLLFELARMVSLPFSTIKIRVAAVEFRFLTQIVRMA